jgi:hypothetical protein
MCPSEKKDRVAGGRTNITAADDSHAINLKKSLEEIRTIYTIISATVDILSIFWFELAKLECSQYAVSEKRVANPSGL